MPKQHTVASLTLEPRAAIGTTSSQRLRKTGKIPGVVYGHGESTPSRSTRRQLADLLHSGNKSKIVDATIGDKHDSVLLRRVEAHPISRRPLSVDFQRVSRDEAITSNVTVVTTGTPGRRARQRRRDGHHQPHARDQGPGAVHPRQPHRRRLRARRAPARPRGQVTLPKDFTLITPPETVVVSVEITRALAAEEAPAEPRRGAARGSPAGIGEPPQHSIIVGLGNPSLVVGLGNPGSRYALTRHNAGFIVVDALAERWGVRDWQRKGEARYAIDRSRNAILVKPQSYMNLSGPPALGLATFYKVPPPRILVVVDDLDLPFGTLRMRAERFERRPQRAQVADRGVRSGLPAAAHRDRPRTRRSRRDRPRSGRVLRGRTARASDNCRPRRRGC